MSSELKLIVGLMIISHKKCINLVFLSTSFNKLLTSIVFSSSWHFQQRDEPVQCFSTADFTLCEQSHDWLCNAYSTSKDKTSAFALQDSRASKDKVY